MANLNSIVQRLNPSVKVVTLEELIIHLRNNFGLPVRQVFQRGDANADGSVDISDAKSILGLLFLGSPSQLPCKKSGDANDSGEIDISDAAYILSYLFLGSPGPGPPYPGCGVDPTGDELSCDSFAPCP